MGVKIYGFSRTGCIINAPYPDLPVHHIWRCPVFGQVGCIINCILCPFLIVARVLSFHLTHTEYRWSMTLAGRSRVPWHTRPFMDPMNSWCSVIWGETEFGTGYPLKWLFSGPCNFSGVASYGQSHYQTRWSRGWSTNSLVINSVCQSVIQPFPPLEGYNRLIPFQILSGF